MSILIISRYHPDDFSDPQTSLAYHIQLDMYSETECKAIIMKDFTNFKYDPTSLSYFVGSIVGIVHMNNPDLFVMRKLIHKNLDLFMKPAVEGSCSPQDFRRLWALFEPSIVTKTNEIGGYGQTRLTCLDPYPRDKMADELLPYDSNVVIVAAYLASYNPPSSDAR